MNQNELMHFGILGMKWGVRRYQNKDGSLNDIGQKRYQAQDSDSQVTKKVKSDLINMTGKEFKQKYQTSNTTYMKRVDKYLDPYMKSPLAKVGKDLKKNEERAKQLVKKYGDKYTITTTKDGIYLKDGKDVWKIQ